MYLVSFIHEFLYQVAGIFYRVNDTILISVIGLILIAALEEKFKSGFKTSGSDPLVHNAVLVIAIIWVSLVKGPPPKRTRKYCGHIEYGGMAPYRIQG